MLRNVVIQMPESCDTAALQSANFDSVHRVVHSLGCSDTYTSTDRLQVGVCSAGALCVESTSTAERLVGLYCTCRAPAYPNPDLAPTYAPYEVGGCQVPRRMEQLTLTSTSVQRSLRKPEHLIERVNLTISMTGDDGAATAFNVTNAPSLPPWLKLAYSGAAIPADAETVEVPVILNATGLSERTYEAELSITVASKQVNETAVVRQCVMHHVVHIPYIRCMQEKASCQLHHSTRCTWKAGA